MDNAGTIVRITPSPNAIDTANLLERIWNKSAKSDGGWLENSGVSDDIDVETGRRGNVCDVHLVGQGGTWGSERSIGRLNREDRQDPDVTWRDFNMNSVCPVYVSRHCQGSSGCASNRDNETRGRKRITDKGQ